MKTSTIKKTSKQYIFWFLCLGMVGLFNNTKLYAQLSLSGGVVNAYYPVSTISGTTITIGSGTGASHTLAVGDKVLLVQMTGNTSVNGGKFEYANVTAVSGSSITVNGIARSYTPSTEKVQLIWVPFNATGITLTANITPLAWNGSTGGIVSIMTPGTLTMNGTIVANGAGFRDTDTQTIYGAGTWGGGAGGSGVGGGGGGGGGYSSSTSTDIATSGASGLGGRGTIATGGTPTYGGGMGLGFTLDQYYYTTTAEASGDYGGGGGGEGGGSDAALAGYGGTINGGAAHAVWSLTKPAGGGGGGGGVGGGGAGGAAGPHGGGGGGGASVTQAGCGGVGGDNTANVGGVGATNGTGWTDGSWTPTTVYAYGGTFPGGSGGGGGGGGGYVGGGGGGGSIYSNEVERGGGGGGKVPASFHPYFTCDAYGNCTDPRVWMGGAGQYGVDGGGIVMVYADKIISNSQTITANGEDGISKTGIELLATFISSPIAGGGGGGGLILINTNNVSAGTLSLCATGGKGIAGFSDDTHGWGSSGGGGSGVVWVNNPAGGTGSNINAPSPPVVANLSFCINGGLPGPSVPNAKTATFSGSGGCGGGGITMVNNNCAIFGTCCTAPTATAAATNATCSGPTANSDGTITISSFTTGQRYQYTTGTTFSGTATPSTITAIPVGGVIENTLPNTTQSYTVRIYDASSDGCYTDVTVSITAQTCSCPVVAAPAVSDAARCGAGSLSAIVTTACSSSSSMKIFSEASLQTDITSSFTLTSSNVTSSSLSSTTTYYAACVDNTYTSCISSGDAFTLTINSFPTVTASATNATCSGPTVNSDGTITLAGFSTEKYDYTLGATYTGSATYATATAIPAGGVIVNNLPNPASSQSYTVRVFNSADCYIDIVVTLTATNCSCPVVAAPAVSDAARCGAGSLSAIVTTACSSSSSMKIFSDASLQTDITSSFTLTSSSVTSSSLSSTTTYYAACVDNTYTSCKSSGDAFTLTINSFPTVTASATNATCSGPTINSDGTITLAGFTTEKYDYTLGATYTGSATYATATAIPAGGVIVNNLPNPASSQSYTVRVFNSADCYIDIVVTLTATTCSCPVVAAPAVSDAARCGAGSLSAIVTTACSGSSSMKIFSDASLQTDITSSFTLTSSSVTSSSLSSTTTYYAACVDNTYTSCKSSGDAFTLTINSFPTVTASATNATCSGPTINSDGTITLAGFTTEKYDYTLGATYTGSATYATATAIPAGGVIVNNLPNPASSQSYTVRVFNSADCYIDIVVTLTATNCSCPVVAAPAVSDAARCGAGSLSAIVTTACSGSSSMKIFSEASLQTDITSSFTLTSSSVTSSSLSSTTTYYAACVDNTYTSCKSSGDTFTLTINSFPTTTASATNTTCNGPTINSDGTITLAGFTTEKYDYTLGATYTGSATYATATAIPAGGVIVNNLPNPASSQSYTVRVFNSADCYIDIVVTLTATNCSCPVVAAPAVSDAARCGAGTLSAIVTTACSGSSSMKIFSDASLQTDITSSFTLTSSSVTSSSLSSTTTYYAACVDNTYTSCKSSGDAFTLTINSFPTVTASATNATCNGPTINSDGTITLAGFTTEKYDYTLGATYTGSATYATATAIPAGGVIVNNLPNPASSQSYTVRVFNSADCYIDIVVTLTATNCSCPVVAAPAVSDAARCGAGSLSAIVTTACSGSSSMKIFSDASLQTDITSNFTLTSSSVTSSSLSSTTTYYAACVDNTYTSCKSSGDAFTLTINSFPTTTASATNATCNGATTNSDGKITLAGFTTEKYDYTLGATYTGSATYATATAIPAGGVIVNNLPNPASSQSYTVRVFNSADCYIDIVVTLTATNCTVACTKPNAGTDMAICLPKTTADLVDAATGTQWIADPTNTTTAIIDATTGVISGMTATGTYKFILQTTGNTSCADTMQIVVSPATAPIILCNNGSTSYTLSVPSTYTNVIWYNMAGVQVGTGLTLIVTSNTLGLSDGSESYYYTANGTTGCDSGSCCPVNFITQTCCSTPNCGTAVVKKN